MRTSSIRQYQAGYISTLLVLATGAILTILTVYAYKTAIMAQAVQTQVQLRVDYSEKEEAILRSIVAIAPNRAIRAMQSESNSSDAIRNPLRWEDIFKESLVLANARTSISPQMMNSLGIENFTRGNLGDSALDQTGRIFASISPDTGYVSAGINRNLGTGYPYPLTSNDATTSSRDSIYPIISNQKIYGSLAQAGVDLPVGSYPNFNLMKYPNINFGYAKPGEKFVAKRNWWAFSVDVADHDDDQTYLARLKRNFVFSIYEIPSQLAISASSFVSLGQFAGGSAWQNVTIEGGIFAGKAEVLGNTAINSLASRRGTNLSEESTVGGQSFTASPFTPGVREAYQITSGAFFPVSQSSESGRSAFIPINRGAEFFDRFAHEVESNAISSTSWNDYSVGSLQCAMRLDVTAVQSSTNATPTMLRFQYFLTSGVRASMSVPLTTATQSGLPAGYVKICDENQSYSFSSTTPVDIAYGASGGFTFRQGITGTITFNNNTFGDPLFGTFKGGYWRPRAPFEVKMLASGQTCIALYPERIPSFLTTIGAAGSSINHSIAINVDYSTSGLNNTEKYKPYIPCTANDYGLILKECANLTQFTKGFSIVTNLRLYIGDDFNTVATNPPAGYTPVGYYYPPCSLFAPEKRYGVDIDPFSVILGGQIGSLASDSATTAVRPLDSKNLSGNAIPASNIIVNLRPIAHPSELPPITMMNWLVVLEERRKEFY